ncbi:hypothetical protein NX059_004695 [Plenodomus lindquistii]|nr:hypothetical protein NX059_004695 [Plenodomus lindquistii]
MLAGQLHLQYSSPNISVQVACHPPRSLVSLRDQRYDLKRSHNGKATVHTAGKPHATSNSAYPLAVHNAPSHNPGNTTRDRTLDLVNNQNQGQKTSPSLVCETSKRVPITNTLYQPSPIYTRLSSSSANQTI